jgi:hypothetical protein
MFLIRYANERQLIIPFPEEKRNTSTTRSYLVSHIFQCLQHPLNIPAGEQFIPFPWQEYLIAIITSSVSL